MQWSADFLTTSKTCILLMAKTPRIGEVKSRLGVEIGDPSAFNLYTCFLRDMVETLRGLEVDYIIYYTPEETLDLLKEYLGESHKYMSQVGDNLGEKLYNGLKKARALGYHYSIALASDAPDIKDDYLREACMALLHHQAVIGPSHDGGYNLIGLDLDLNNPDFFSGVEWGTESVYEETMVRLSEIDVYVLPIRRDVDTVSDLYNLDLDEASYTYKYVKANKLI